ncbi:MAG: 4Fe-4S binding protein [Anaerosomatales bacterium]
MPAVRIENDACDRSPGCPARRVCPRGAIQPLVGGSYPGANGYYVVEEKCTGCGVCARACAGGAVTFA